MTVSRLSVHILLPLALELDTHQHNYQEACDRIAAATLLRQNDRERLVSAMDGIHESAVRLSQVLRELERKALFLSEDTQSLIIDTRQARTFALLDKACESLQYKSLCRTWRNHSLIWRSESQKRLANSLLSDSRDARGSSLNLVSLATESLDLLMVTSSSCHDYKQQFSLVEESMLRGISVLRNKVKPGFLRKNPKLNLRDRIELQRRLQEIRLLTFLPRPPTIDVTSKLFFERVVKTTKTIDQAIEEFARGDSLLAYLYHSHPRNSSVDKTLPKRLGAPMKDQTANLQQHDSIEAAIFNQSADIVEILGNLPPPDGFEIRVPDSGRNIRLPSAMLFKGRPILDVDELSKLIIVLQALEQKHIVTRKENTWSLEYSIQRHTERIFGKVSAAASIYHLWGDNPEHLDTLDWALGYFGFDKKTWLEDSSR